MWPHSSQQQNIVVEHPSGKIDLLLEGSVENNTLNIKSAGLMRTARMLFKGEVHIPAKVWVESQMA
jgi:2-methylaconitate cis-trans-isomerase PrpF